ncbi:MAG: SRPBCC family protein [Proteobacteria bacterium]|nr:SRPBCC family protein [Pseudomonadota bacterium]
MSTKKKILLALWAVMTALVLVAGFKPAEYTISRKIEIKASAEQIFPFLNHSQKANSWMPWTESDPQLQMSYDGPEEGVGSKASWKSSGKMGVGSSEVIESVPLKLVRSKLTYLEPMNMEQEATTTIENAHGLTIVTWSVTGKNSFLGRLASIFINMDQIVGSEFEKGLVKLKSIVEPKN